MVVQTGKDKIFIKKKVLEQICNTLGKYSYETGGIIGVNKSGEISAFQFDEAQSFNRFEYCPNVEFLNYIINEKWAKENINFVGFVHSHLNNNVLSSQDIEYAREILNENICLDRVILGIFNLNCIQGDISWYSVAREKVN